MFVNIIKLNNRRVCAIFIIYHKKLEGEKFIFSILDNKHVKKARNCQNITSSTASISQNLEESVNDVSSEGSEMFATSILNESNLQTLSQVVNEECELDNSYTEYSTLSTVEKCRNAEIELDKLPTDSRVTFQRIIQCSY